MTDAVGRLISVDIVNKTPPPGPFVVGNHPTINNPRKLQDCDSLLLFKGPKALKVPSRHQVEVKVKPAIDRISHSGSIDQHHVDTTLGFGQRRLFVLRSCRAILDENFRGSGFHYQNVAAPGS